MVETFNPLPNGPAVKKPDSTQKTFIYIFSVWMPPDILFCQGKYIMDYHLGLGHLIKANSTVGAANSRLFYPTPGSFGEAMAHEMIVNRNHTSLNLPSQFLSPSSISRPY